ncbi:hypothetical protein GCM10009863_07020 [Streptomyces axinellae]|uniref:DUF5753 domain-containing protein n=1 Tax=Streptomyces axinellae TaxID=552788 RepID=A0ABP6C435_9ACTN
MIPGLLQTGDHAQAVFTSRVPRFHEEEIAQKVAARMERQHILHRKAPPTSSFVLSEGLVRTRLGGREVWREQLRHLLRRTDIPGLTIQIMPFDRPTHGSLTGPFVLRTTGPVDLAWFKSSYSGEEGGNCLEVAYDWYKSS